MRKLTWLPAVNHSTRLECRIGSVVVGSVIHATIANRYIARCDLPCATIPDYLRTQFSVEGAKAAVEVAIDKWFEAIGK